MHSQVCMLQRILVAPCVVYISDKVVIKAPFLVFLLFVVDVLSGKLACFKELLPWCLLGLHCLMSKEPTKLFGAFVHTVPKSLSFNLC